MEEGSSGGTSPCEGFHEVDPGGRAPLPGNPKDGIFERLARFPVDGPLSLQGGPCWGTWRRFLCRDFREIRKVYLGSFLGPRFVKIRALLVGHLSARDSIKGTFREDSCTGEPKR
jgi:hypothetical protein